MNDPYPCIKRSASEVHVRLLPDEPASSVSIEAVVDLTDLGDLSGIEILDARRQLLGAIVPDGPAAGYPRWGYDAEIDALYVHIASGRGQRQKKRTLLAGVDCAGRLVDLRVPVDE